MTRRFFYVVRDVQGFEMVRTTAGWIYALVMNLVSLGNWADKNFVREPVRHNRLSTVPGN
jgi:hypothetical protein